MSFVEKFLEPTLTVSFVKNFLKPIVTVSFIENFLKLTLTGVVYDQTPCFLAWCIAVQSGVKAQHHITSLHSVLSRYVS